MNPLSMGFRDGAALLREGDRKMSRGERVIRRRATVSPLLFAKPSLIS